MEVDDLKTCIEYNCKFQYRLWKNFTESLFLSLDKIPLSWETEVMCVIAIIEYGDSSWTLNVHVYVLYWWLRTGPAPCVYNGIVDYYHYDQGYKEVTVRSKFVL